MLRAAAKNFRSVTVVPSSEFYEEVLAALENEGQVPEECVGGGARCVPADGPYDAAISDWLGEQDEGGRISRARQVPRAADCRLRAGLRVALRGEPASGGSVLRGGGCRTPVQRRGEVAGEGDLLQQPLRPGCGPHPPRRSHRSRRGRRHRQARQPLRRRGGGVDRGRVPQSLSLGPTVRIRGHRRPQRRGRWGARLRDSRVFTEILVAPGFTEKAREILSSKPNVRVLVAGPLSRPRLSAKQVTGGVLLQDTDTIEDDSEYEVVTEAHPSEQQMEDLLFAWRVARVVKSNAIVLTREGATVGVGAGHISRVDSSEIAVKKAGERSKGPSLPATPSSLSPTDRSACRSRDRRGHTARRLRTRRRSYRSRQPSRARDGLTGHRIPSLVASHQGRRQDSYRVNSGLAGP